MYKCAKVQSDSSDHCKLLPSFYSLNSGFLMNPPSFWAHNGALYMSMKEIAALKWSSSSQSSKKLKGKVLKACDVGLLLSGGGQAPKYVHTDDVEKIVVLEMRDEARRIIAQQKGHPAKAPLGPIFEGGVEEGRSEPP